ncbi:MAG: type II secretion system protein, partial [Oscillospiraceae bacterium]|nr:type II secretion system protein [Oscillospiraceae bacterium]
MKMHTAKRGFTIVELVIVIAVIAILAAVLIPTFASLIKKANESVDIRLVREMNTILKADEAEKGKPAGVDAVRAILAENGIADFTPAMAEHAFAWDKEENVVVLINTTTQLGVFPKEYKDVPYEASWELLAGNVEISMEDLGATLDEAIANAKPGQTIVLTSDQTLNATDPIEFADIDLGGHKLTLTNGLPMNAHSSVTLSNGDVESSQITLPAGAELTLNEVDLVA